MTQHVGIAGAGDLGDDVLHVPGREELALLDVDDPAGLRRRRPAGRSGGRGRPGSAARRPPRPTAAHCSRSCTSVRTGRPSVSRISAKIGSAASSPMPRAPVRAGAVGLVEGGLVDEADPQPRARSPSAPAPSPAHARGSRSGRGRRSARAAESLPNLTSRDGHRRG